MEYLIAEREESLGVGEVIAGGCESVWEGEGLRAEVLPGLRKYELVLMSEKISSESFSFGHV